ncbi:MAG: hypothetical protein KDJ35_08200 [Alphaproteobacteria bacterium]|nr:hypothetical protein [Alphaproteobacteria bacterium]
MLKFRTPLLLSMLAGIALLAAPAMAEEAHADCDAHAAHIDHEIGAEHALEAFHVLHGDQADEHGVVEALKAEHPDLEHELEEYANSGCTAAELEAHAHDADVEPEAASDMEEHH